MFFSPSASAVVGTSSGASTVVGTPSGASNGVEQLLYLLLFQVLIP